VHFYIYKEFADNTIWTNHL